MIDGLVVYRFYLGEKYLIEISKEEMEVLIDKGFLRLRNGKYPGLTICSKRKKGNGKSRFVQENIAEKLRYCR